MCDTDNDCGLVGNRCVSFGSEKYCALACEDDATACPEDTACQDHGGDLLCVPDAGDCTCTPAAVQACVEGELLEIDSCGHPVLYQNTNELHLRLQSGLAVGCGLRLWMLIAA